MDVLADYTGDKVEAARQVGPLFQKGYWEFEKGGRLEYRFTGGIQC